MRLSEGTFSLALQLTTVSLDIFQVNHQFDMLQISKSSLAWADHLLNTGRYHLLHKHERHLY